MARMGKCCCNNCLIFTDEFGTSYLDDLGDNWCENASQWKIEDSAAVSESGGARAICNVPHPVPDGSMVVVIETDGEIEGSNQTYRVMLNIVKTDPEATESCTTNNFYFCDFTRKGVNDSILSIGICSGGVETVLKSDLIVGLTGTSRNVAVVLSELEFCASVSNAVLSFVGTVPPGLFATGYYSGVQVSHADMRIDTFWFYQHHATNPECLNCLCGCEAEYIPPVLRVRIYPDPESCPRLDLLDDCLDWEIEWDRVNSKWVGEHVCCHGNQTWRISFKCPLQVYGVDDPYTAVMNVEVGCTSSSTQGTGNNLPIAASCSPLFFKYGPFLVTGFDLTCFCTTATNPLTRPSCNYYVEILQVP